MKIPKGWMLVPVEPTVEMQEAARHTSDQYPYKPAPDGQRLGYLQVGMVWKAMISTAPKPAAAPDPEGKK